MSTKRRKKMASSPQRRNGSGVNITSDWVKTMIAIIVQSIAVGFYLASVKSDLGHLTSDFTEFKGQMKSEVKQLNESFSQMVQMKSKMDMMAEGTHDKLSKVDSLDKDIKDSQDKIQELRFQLKDQTRDITNLKDQETSIKELQKSIEEIKQRELYEKKNIK